MPSVVCDGSGLVGQEIARSARKPPTIARSLVNPGVAEAMVAEAGDARQRAGVRPARRNGRDGAQGRVGQTGERPATLRPRRRQERLGAEVVGQHRQLQAAQSGHKLMTGGHASTPRGPRRRRGRRMPWPAGRPPGSAPAARSTRGRPRRPTDRGGGPPRSPVPRATGPTSRPSPGRPPLAVVPQAVVGAPVARLGERQQGEVALTGSGAPVTGAPG